MRAGDEVTVPREDGGGWGGVGRGVAGRADDIRAVSLAGDGGTQQQVKGKGDWEVCRVSKGEEGVMGEGRVWV